MGFQFRLVHWPSVLGRRKKKEATDPSSFSPDPFTPLISAPPFLSLFQRQNSFVFELRLFYFFRCIHRWIKGSNLGQ
ncbi:hypothetical protein L1987_72559 [Smallanthus sonchifolius]|uniref:Uncharacterized protein n=1 Tax=Smallanthus sonchifolius TaxID=185202 RepID=A0ACB9AWF4_9ASTR|nr:hypothetical protein L1987_72559 [Smallanthus sonchifolius]